jgi:peroxiredoxin
MVASGGSNGHILTFTNGEERIQVEDVVLHGDSILIRMPLYDSQFKGVMTDAGRFEGWWYNYSRGQEYKIPFVATAGSMDPPEAFASANVEGRWEVRFGEGGTNSYPAIGIFHQRPEGHATGTFLTESGDYRYLEGVVSRDSLILSSFDGSRAVLFKAQIDADTMTGGYWSGNHFSEQWRAVRNDRSTLRHPDSITTALPGHHVEFAFPDLDGNMVSFADQRFQGRPCLIQIMGSWCANCVDEARCLNELFQKYNPRGLQVVALAFEKHEDPQRIHEVLRRFANTLSLEYPVLYAGRAKKEEVMSALPFLDGFSSYPTCIFVDHAGNIRRIHTGFNGPGTGSTHQQHKDDISSFVEMLLNEAEQPVSRAGP